MLNLLQGEWDAESTVDKLFMAGSHHWNMGLLYNLFSQEEVEQMLSIPLSMQRVTDWRIWHFECDGKCFVRSTYHVVRSISAVAGDGATGSASLSDDGRTKLWKKIWNACVPGRLK